MPFFHNSLVAQHNRKLSPCVFPCVFLFNGSTPCDPRCPHADRRTVAFRYEFKADHTFEMSVELKGGMLPRLTPQLAGKHAVRGTWNVVEVSRDTLTVELPDPKLTAAGLPATRVKVVFQTPDRCLFGADSDEAMVLTRLP
jgi:hypothetical protein